MTVERWRPRWSRRWEPFRELEEEIDVSVASSVLTIKGERKAEEEIRDEDYYCCERFRGSFYRAIQLPTDVETEKIEVKLR